MNRNILRQPEGRGQSHHALKAPLLTCYTIALCCYTPKIPQIVSGEELGRGAFYQTSHTPQNFPLQPTPSARKSNSFSCFMPRLRIRFATLSISDKEPPHASAYMHKLVTRSVAGTSFGFPGVIIQDNEVLIGYFLAGSTPN